MWDVGLVWTANPALVLNDLLTNSAYGLGLDQSQVDLFSLAEAARYCDELVPVEGPDEYRFQFDHQFAAQTSALQAITAIASSMNAEVWWGEGQVFVSQDRPASATRLFGPGNVIDGAFSYGRMARRGHSSSAVISYRDRDRNYVNSVDREQRLWLVDRYGEQEIAQRAVGITRATGARRRGRYILEMGEVADQTVSFRTGPEGMALSPGQVIQLSDAMWEPIRATGRTGLAVHGPGGTNVTIDKAFTFDIAKTYTLHVMDTIPNMVTHPVANPGTTTEVVPLSTPLVDTVGGHSTWIITEATELEAREYRILEVAEAGLMDFEVRATLYDGTAFDRIEDLSAVDVGWPFPI